MTVIPSVVKIICNNILVLLVYKFDTLKQLKLVYYCNSVYLSDISRCGLGKS